MPELPEVEHLMRTLKPALIGAAVQRVTLARRDVVRFFPTKPRIPTKAALLENSRITRLERHGKQFAIITDTGRAVCIHLGMSGQLRVSPAVRAGHNGEAMTHIHCRWRVQREGEQPCDLLFRDPRRFGGVWTFPSFAQLNAERWSRLGPDALTVAGPVLHAATTRTQRPIKCVLLDQGQLAGVGNIYADEALFAAGIDPRAPASLLSRDEVNALARSIRATLRRAIAAGGSTLRDYRDGAGNEGGYQARHAAYGRAGLACLRCGSRLASQALSQRTTVWCPQCQTAGRGTRCGVSAAR